MQQIAHDHRSWTVRRPSAASFALMVALCVSGGHGRAAVPAPDGYHAYALTSVSAAQVIPELKELLATLPEPASVVADSQGGRILVQGTPQVHALTAEFVQLIDRATEARQVSQSSGRPPAAPAGPQVAEPLVLRHISWQTLHKGLERLLEHGLPATTLRSDQGETVQFHVQAAPNAEVAIEAGPAAGQITLRGRADLVRSWAQVIRALDVPANASGDKTELVAVRAAQPRTLHRALTAIQTSAASRSNGRDRMVAMLFQPKARQTAEAGETGQAGQADQPGEPIQGEAFSGQGLGPAVADLLSGGAIGPVDIQFLEGSDIIVIRGHERDVARVRQLIEQIEQLSKETKPEVVVRPLEHVSSEALGALLDSLYEEVFLPRQGAVSITPLVKPNALLLIGRKENVKTVVDLVAKLDQPVPPATQFQVFQLKHASAVDAKTTIDEFLDTQADEEQTDLSVRGRVTADFRSNSLIVQASPRDLAEIAALVARIDTSTSEAVNEVRIFQLENALADDMVQILQYAVEQQGHGGRLGRG